MSTSSQRADACAVFNRALERMPTLPACLVREIAGKGVGMLAQRKLYPGGKVSKLISKNLPGDLIVAEKPVLTMPQAIFDSDRESTIEWLDKSISQLGAVERELLLSLTDHSSNPDDPEDLTYIGLLYTNCMAWEGDVVVCPLLATANHACRPNAQFLPRLDKGYSCGKLKMAKRYFNTFHEYAICRSE